MAAEVIETAKALKLVVKTGVNDSGTDKMSTRTISNINPTATNDNLLTFGDGIGTLIKYPVDSLKVATTDTIAAGA